MQKTHCAEVRSVTTAPPQLLGPAFLPLVFPANAGTQGPSSSGRQPKGHRATMTSAAQRVLFFKRAQAPCQQKTYCAEVQFVTTQAPSLLGYRSRMRNECGMNQRTLQAERPLR